MTSSATPRRATVDPVVTFVVDPEAEPGDVVPALARLLIDIDRRRKAAAHAQHDGRGDGDTE